LNGDVAAGCPAVFAPGAAVGVGVVAGGGGAVTRAGAAGLAVRTRGRDGAVTVTAGTATLGPVSGAVCGGAGVVCGASEVVCEGWGGEASDAGDVVVGGVSDGMGGVCDEAAPVRQSATSADPLRRSKRLVEMDMITPNP
jgi:hypothetical protein